MYQGFERCIADLSLNGFLPTGCAKAKSTQKWLAQTKFKKKKSG
jgi:hypothetical protein